MKFPHVSTYGDVVRICKEARTNAHLRPGQAVCNKYQLPKDLEDAIWEMKEDTRVHQRVWNYFNPANYQGGVT
jgi:hypothetical protein